MVLFITERHEYHAACLRKGYPLVVIIIKQAERPTVITDDGKQSLCLIHLESAAMSRIDNKL